MTEALRAAVTARRTLKKRLAQARRLPGAGDAGELCEHAELLHTALAGTAAYIKKHKRDGLSSLWRRCMAFLQASPLPDEAAAGAFFGAQGLSLAEAAALGALLPGAAVCMGAAGYGSGALGQAVKTLFRLREFDFEALLPRVCPAERILRGDPAYRLSDADTRARVRRLVTRRAEENSESETETALAERIVRQKGGVFAALPQTPKPGAGVFFLCAEAALPLAFVSAAVCAVRGSLEGVWRQWPGMLLLTLLLYLPLLFALRPLLQAAVETVVKPFALPSLDPENPEVSLPPVLIAVASLLPKASEAPAFAAHLKRLYAGRGNCEAAVLALLDPKNAPTPETPADAADLAAMRREIERLNAEAGGGFLLAVRGRVFSPTENEYTGFERKRGAVEALVRRIKEGAEGFELLCGDVAFLDKTKYILALDADTALPFASLEALVCVACHPANRAEWDPEARRVVSGYGCFAPRTEVSFASAAATRFARLMTQGGVSAYAPRVSSRYMDLFGASVFCGKGLIDVDVYHAACCGAFPQGKILSHDILEGSLLRTAFVSTVTLTEGFPASPASYYKRQNRWVRGDVQNLAFVLRPLNGGRRLPGLAKYQLADNALRALQPVFCLALLLASVLFPFKAALPMFLIALSGAAAGPLLGALRVLLAEGLFGFSRVRFFTGLSAGAKTSARALLRVAFLPYEAAVNLDAALRAWWRAAVSGKRTLEWTTAADAEKKGRPAALYPVIWPFLCALALSFGYPFHIFPAALFLLCAPFAVSDGRRTKRPKPRLTDGEADALRQYAAATWRYFETYAGETDHFLPPDNVQETPVYRVAHRTSPTNIGLYLLCALAAADLSLISPEALSERLCRAVETLRALPRYRGLLYNWYDTETLEPLPPAFVSSVDCGNYLVCLTALKEGLREYAPLGMGFASLIKEIEEALANARLECLYAPRRRLFSVGLDVSSGKLSDSYYDFYMSEARMTSFFACAKGLVPASHWAALDRAFLRRGGRAAAASYSGTMFEYFMPALFLPLYENTYAPEGLAGCLYAQKRRVRGTPRPWGVTESGYYDFDGDMNYRYRAHGLKTLAMKRDPNDRPVFAPYASFLALVTDPHGALKNLRRFASLGAYGACGFYEAVDFSAAAPGEDYMIVRSFMAHHAGMSLLAAVNALRGNVFVRRFARDPKMERALSLLQEKLPAGAPIRRLRRFAEPKKRPPRPHASRAAAPEGAALYANGEVSLSACPRGNYFLYGGRSMLRYAPRARGIAAAVFAEGKTLRFPDYRLLSTGVYAKTETPSLSAESAFALVDRFSALACPVKLKNRGKTAKTARLAYYFEPDLQPLFAASEHPAFSDLNLRAAYDAARSALVLSRMEKGRNAASLAVGFADLSPFTFSCDRELFAGDDPFAVFPAALDNAVSFAFPAAAVQTELRLEPGAKKEKILLLCPGPTPAQALNTLARMRRARLPDLRRAVRQAFDADTVGYGSRFLRTVLFGARDPEREANALANTAPVSALWEQGISGDLPVISVQADGLPAPVLGALVRLHQRLAFGGIPADLALLTRKPAAYRGEPVGALRKILPPDAPRRHIFILSAEQCSPAFLSALAAAPGLRFPFAETALPPDAPEPPLLPSSPPATGEDTFVPGGYFIGAPPPRPWCHTLSNAVFGTLLGYGTLGFTWAMNARLNQLTPWHNDPASPFSGETLLLAAAEGVYDALSGASVWLRDTEAEYTAVCGKTQLRVTVRVDAVAMKKRVLVRWNGEAPCKLIYRVCPLMCDSPKRAPFLRGWAQNGALVFQNPANTDYPGVMRLCADAPAEAFYAAGEGRLAVSLPAGAGETAFTVAFAANETAAAVLCSLPFRPKPAKVCDVPVKDPLAARFVNGLLLHGVVDTRVLARTGFYQNSGAYGFRDQLQDTANVCALYPDLAKRQLLRCAAAQFPEGDVLHWFHVIPSGKPHLKGVRTLCADDRLWLPWAAAEYVRVTGDADALVLPVPYLEGEPLREGERERYGDYYAGALRESLYAHCMRAIRRSLRFGEHALPLFLGGDWNDSFNELGLGGRGESTWLGMFMITVCEAFAPLCRRWGDAEGEKTLLTLAADLRLTVHAAAFNGVYYLRGFTDAGVPLGAAGGPCAIDLLPQAFAVFARVGTREERISALRAAYNALFDPAHRLLRLFSPPFDDTAPRAGYVNDYPPGVRENGGQYTHAAVWFAMALRREGLAEEADALLPALIPALRQNDSALWRRFGNEPYAVTADLSAAPGREGAGGWSLYTGAAGWLWRMFGE